MLEFKRTSDPIGAWMEDNCIFEADAFVARKATFEDYKNYPDQELGKTRETERRFYQRLRDTPKVKDHNSHKEGRGFKGIRLKEPDDQPQKETQTKLISTAVTAGATDNFNCQKILAPLTEKFSMTKNLRWLRCPLKTAMKTRASLLSR
jgi:phage/plasmid-associated DNA primase